MPEIFTNPSGLFDRFVVLAPDAIVIANPESHRLDALVAAFQADGTLPADALVIPHGVILTIRANRHRDDVNVTFSAQGRSLLKNISFQTAAVRDKALSALRRQTGRVFRWREVQYSVLRAAAWPIAAVLGLAAFTYLSAGAAADLAAGAEAAVRGRHQTEKTIFVTILRLLGPVGVSLLGTFASAGAVAWLVARVRKPPRMVIVTTR